LVSSGFEEVLARIDDGSKPALHRVGEGKPISGCLGLILVPAGILAAGQRGGLFHPVRHPRLVELVAFVDVDVARVLALLAPGGTGRSDVPRKKATLT
jgi:hypothetical protein